jgi:diguanylate cyclase (GGDEF)-like protein/PAS domain S-box-containing protein
MTERLAARRIIVYAFILVIAIMVAITAIGLSRTKNLARDLERVVQERDVQIALMHQMRSAARERSILLQSMMIIKDPFTIDDYAMQMSEMASLYFRSREELLRHPLSPQERQLLQAQHAQTVKTGSSQNQIIDHIRNESYPAAASTLIYTTLPGQRRAMGMMDEFITTKRRQNLADLNTTSSTISRTYSIMLLLGGLGVLFSIAVATYVSRRISREISRRQLSESELRHSELRERTIRENIIDGVLTLDAEGHILSCNKACKAIFGYSHQDMLGQSAHMLMPSAFSERSRDKLGRHLRRWEKGMLGMGREVSGRRADGGEFPAELDISRITLDGEIVYIAVIRDITAKKEAEQRLQQFNQELERRVIERTEELANTNDKLRHEINERVKAQHELTHLANHDSLTDLPNRAMFSQHLDVMLHHAKRHERRLALLFMDLDGFKAVNDRYGHEAGDQLLIEIASRMRRCVRKEDMVARMGGDEFTILLGELQSDEDAALVADKLITAINQPVQLMNQTCHVGISIGISLFPHDAAVADTLLRLADDAMYAAKSAGKNTYRYTRREPVPERLAELLPAPQPT